MRLPNAPRVPQASSELSRREFVKGALLGAAAIGFPTIIPARVLGASAPSNFIQVAQIGCGRIARQSEIPGMFRNDKIARIVALCDFDSIRLADAKELVEQTYSQTFGQTLSPKTYANYREMLQDKSIDAVCISTPDHWHALPAIEAALAGKDVYLQKPASLTLKEGRQMADVFKKTKCIFQQGSQQRSEAHFVKACELVRNGRIGKIKEIYIGLPVDVAGGRTEEMPVPKNLNYDMWLGSTPVVHYTQDRVHPQAGDLEKRYDRPGWLRCQQFGAGMITGWGAHHLDIAHWGMGTEHTGPIEIEGKAEFLKGGLWDVHGPFDVTARYANGVVMQVSDKFPVGILFVGENGQWIWVSRTQTKLGHDDPHTGRSVLKAIDASDPKLLDYRLKDSDVHLHHSPKNDHHLDWLTSIQTRQEPAAPAEVGHRSCSACLVSQIAMKLGHKLTFDPAREQFVNDDEANTMLSRPQRQGYSTDEVMKAHGMA